MDISIVIPLYNEAESLPHLFEWIEKVMGEHKFLYEIIFVNDGSTDDSWQVIKKLKESAPQVVKATSFRHNYGKSAACGTRRRCYNDGRGYARLAGGNT